MWTLEWQLTLPGFLVFLVTVQAGSLSDGGSVLELGPLQSTLNQRWAGEAAKLGRLSASSGTALVWTLITEYLEQTRQGQRVQCVRVAMEPNTVTRVTFQPVEDRTT